MKIVLYTYDFEPITVIEVDLSLIKRLIDNHCYSFRMASYSKLDVNCWENPVQPVIAEYRTVDIDIHELNFFGKKKLIFLVNEKDLAKSFDLRSTTLPGQRDSLERAFQEGIHKGISSLLTLMGNLDD